MLIINFGGIKMPICPKCKIEMEDETDFEGDPTETEGQLADRLAGFNRTFVCPKCRYADEFDGVEPNPL